jgi:hypothetical protein
MELKVKFMLMTDLVMPLAEELRVASGILTALYVLPAGISTTPSAITV